MRTLIALTVCALLVGCATGRWYHPTATEAKFRQDAAECDYEVKKATAPIRNAFDAGYQQGELGVLCMRTRGYEYRRE
jgi:hypothetical protein